ncbi:hypothetical protein [Haloarchaeobius sp. DFWS5]|uniref:hypothetical protein n=1 Tax=Haloarchaeobius sp. DFWS5 TaxID=3446114 RepID=UPI003EBA07FC
MRETTVTRRQLLGIVAGGSAVGIGGQPVGARPVADDRETFEGNRIGGQAGTAPADDTASDESLDLRVAWAETINGFPVEAFPPGDESGAQAVLWSRSQLRSQHPELDDEAIEERFDAQFTDVSAVFGERAREPLLDLSAAQPGDSGSLTVYLNLVDGDGIVGVSGDLVEGGPAPTPRPTTGREAAPSSGESTTPTTADGRSVATAEGDTSSGDVTTSTDLDAPTTGTGSPDPAADPIGLADAVEFAVVQVVRDERGFFQDVPLVDGTLRSVLAELALAPATLDGDASTDLVDCATTEDILVVRFDWALPEAFAARLDQSSVKFDLGFLAVPCGDDPGASLEVTSRAWTQNDGNSLVYVVRVDNTGPGEATGVVVEPTPWAHLVTGTAGDAAERGAFAACARDESGALNVRGMRVRRGPVDDVLKKITHWHAGAGRTYGELYDPKTGVWEIPAIGSGQSYDLLLNVDTASCATDETLTSEVVVRTQPWWNDRNAQRSARSTTVEVSLD